MFSCHHLTGLVLFSCDTSKMAAVSVASHQAKTAELKRARLSLSLWKGNNQEAKIFESYCLSCGIFFLGGVGMERFLLFQTHLTTTLTILQCPVQELFDCLTFILTLSKGNNLWEMKLE